ncbi:hypothetical protein H5P28_13770 [Ruficoccus amylovorans]|uniref:Uncharacterized protein n=1 Tax=Ruficoccus amylovorans TaxID=1804625 RepID=A0A842HJJ8_9BACT|nr:hypothetical protein [Ruficoccus amylovorans]MBC2595331.1 hypothetical protein [Ruficoccus amylovorans]
MLQEVRSWIVLLLLLAVTGAVGVAGLKLTRAQMAEDIYRDRLTGLASDYARLRDQYERALSQSVVTELDIRNGKLTVRYQRGDGQVAEIPTPLDTTKEIFVDFYVAGNRVGIRRVFDSSMPPDQALVLDEPWDIMANDAPPTTFGRAVYRRLGEGRWSVTMTGNGSLGLDQVPAGQRSNLAPPPPQITPEAPVMASEQAIEEITVTDMFGWLKEQAGVTR